MTRRSTNGRFTDLPPAMLRERAELAAAEQRADWEGRARAAALKAVGTLPSPVSLLRPEARTLALSRALRAVAAVPGATPEGSPQIVRDIARAVIAEETAAVERFTGALRMEWSGPPSAFPFPEYLPDAADAA